MNKSVGIVFTERNLIYNYQYNLLNLYELVAAFLKSASVTVYYASASPASGSYSSFATKLSEIGADCVFLPVIDRPNAASWAVHQSLRDDHSLVIAFRESWTVYSALVSRKLYGQTGTRFGCYLPYPVRERTAHGVLGGSIEILDLAFMDDYALRHADVVFSDSSERLQKHSDSHATRLFIQAPLDLDAGQYRPEQHGAPTVAAKRIVFLSPLAGHSDFYYCSLLLSALRRLEMPVSEVVFIGQVRAVEQDTGVHALYRMSKGLPYPCRIASFDDNLSASLGLLADPDSVVVVNWDTDLCFDDIHIARAVGRRPFVRTSTAQVFLAGREPDDVVPLPDSPSAAAQMVASSEASLMLKAPRQSDLEHAVMECWEALAAAGNSADAASAAAELPLLSICIAHYNMPEMLEQTLVSFERQSDHGFEIVLVDDGSSQSVQEQLGVLLERPWPFKVRYVHTENVHLAAARNLAVANATNPAVLFFDADDIAFRTLVADVRTALARNPAAIIGCTSLRHDGDSYPDEAGEKNLKGFRPPVGGAIAAGIFRNCFGHAVIAMNVSEFNRVGRFVPGFKGFEDYEFLLRAATAGVEILPMQRPIFFYRRRQSGMLSQSVSEKNEERVTQFLRAHLDDDDLVLALNWSRGLARTMRRGRMQLGLGAFTGEPWNVSYREYLDWMALQCHRAAIFYKEPGSQLLKDAVAMGFRVGHKNVSLQRQVQAQYSGQAAKPRHAYLSWVGTALSAGPQPQRIQKSRTPQETRKARGASAAPARSQKAQPRPKSPASPPAHKAYDPATIELDDLRWYVGQVLRTLARGRDFRAVLRIGRAAILDRSRQGEPAAQLNRIARAVLASKRNATIPVAPPPDFNEEAYLRRYDDIARAVMEKRIASGFAHYVHYGRREERSRPRKFAK